MKQKRFATSLAKAPQKKIINDTLASLGNKCGNALVLDGSGRKTTKSLIKAGWPAQKIFIPNNSRDYSYIKRYHENTFKMSVGDFILANRTRTFKLGYAYLDYMCLFKTVKKDLGILFNNQMMMDNSVLGVTFSIDRFRKNDTGFVNRDMMETLNFITTLARCNGYVPVIHTNGGSYRNVGSQMYTVIFELFRYNYNR